MINNKINYRGGIDIMNTIIAGFVALMVVGLAILVLSVVMAVLKKAEYVYIYAMIAGSVLIIIISGIFAVSLGFFAR